MLFNTKKKDKVVFLFIPLLVASLCFFVVYASSSSNYYENYESIISNCYPDYLILNENSSVFQNPNFSKTNINNLFSLEDYEYMGYLESEIRIGEFNRTNFAIIWAPSSYYHKYANLTLNTGEFVIESSLQNEYFNDSNQILISFKLYNGLEINETLLLTNIVQREEIFVSSSLRDILRHEFKPDLFYIFINDETFKNLFVEELSDVKTYNLFLFQFKRDAIYSTVFAKITDFLKVKESQLNSYFGYQYPGDEYSFQQDLLREKLMYFNNEYSFFSNFQLIPVILIVGVFIVSLIYITTKTYISNQRDTINLFRIRGGKKSEIYKLFLRSEIKIMFYTYLVSLLLSIIILLSITPAFLKFSQNYLILAGTQILIVIACGAYQIIMLLRSIGKKNSYQSTKSTVTGRTRSLIKEIGLLSIPSAIFIILITLSLEILWDFQDSLKMWKLIVYFILILIFSFVITRDSLLKIGIAINSVFTKRNKIFRFTKQMSKKIILQRNLMFKLLVIYILLISASFSVIDSYKHYLIENEQFNQLCDITIKYPISSRNNVENELHEYVNKSIELIHFKLTASRVEGWPFSLDGFCINSTKIGNLFENIKFKDSYSGLKTTQEVKEDLSLNKTSMIISKGVSMYTAKSIGENLLFHMRETDKYYSGQIDDFVETIPLFTWFTKNYYSGNTNAVIVKFIILNSDFEDNLLETENLDIISVISLNKTVTKEILIDQITELNSVKHLGIEIIDFTNIRFSDKDYQHMIIQPKFLLILIILLGITLLLFLFENSIQLFNKQVESFKVFFSRGMSIKNGIKLALFPIFIFLNFLNFIGIIIGWILSTMIILAIQPSDSLKIHFFILPLSIILVCCLILSMLIITLIVGIINYKLLKKQIPEISYDEKYIDLVEGI